MGLLHRRRQGVLHANSTEQQKSRPTTNSPKQNGGGRRHQWNNIVSSLRRTQINDASSSKQSNIITEEETSTIDLWTACKMGNTSLVNQIILEQPELIHVEQQGRTPLYYACHGGHYKVVEMLLKAGATDDELKTCYQSALNQKIRNLLQQYQTVDRVLELQQAVLAMECPNCSSSSSRSTAWCDYDDSNNDMYLHLFDTIEATCSHSEDNNQMNKKGNDIETRKIDFPHHYPEEMELAAPSMTASQPEIDCSDSLLTERVNNQSGVVHISVRPQSVITEPANKLPLPQYLIPTFQCSREASLFDSDNMEDGNTTTFDEYDEEDVSLSTSHTMVTHKKATITIETSEKKIEVQETIRNTVPKYSTDPKTTLKDRLFQRVAIRRRNDGLVSKVKNKDTKTKKEEEANEKPLDKRPPLCSRPGTIFGNPRWNRNDNNVTKETVVTSPNGESEIVLHSVQNIKALNDTEKNMNDNTNSAMTKYHLNLLIADDAIECPTLHNRTFNKTETDPSMVPGQAFSSQQSEGEMSVSTYDTFISNDEIKKYLIPIVTVPVEFEDVDGVVESTEGVDAVETLSDNQTPLSQVSTIQDASSDPQMSEEKKDRSDTFDIVDDKILAESESKSKSIESVVHDKIPLHRTIDQDAAMRRTNLLESTLDVFGCVPDEIEDTFTLQSLSFDNHRVHSVSFTTNSNIHAESSDSRPSISVNEKSNVDRTLKLRVDELINETSQSQALKKSEFSEGLEVPAVIKSPSPLSSMSASTDSNLYENDLTDPDDDNDDDDEVICQSVDNRNVPNDNDGDDADSDTLSTSQSADDLLPDNTSVQSPHDQYSIFSLTSSSDSFYDDYDDDDDDDEGDENTMVDFIENDEDEISSPDVPMIFCR